MRNNRPRALIILTPGFPESEADTTSLSHLQTFVRALKEVDPHVEVIVLTLTYPFVSTNYQWYGIKVMSFGNKYKGRVFNVASILKMWGGPKKTKQTISDNRPVKFLVRQMRFYCRPFFEKT
ncbi:hypothetical protein [uncultured Mucilaginibacter sp.]|uniref:hypothetical protein n=1 Tax=uncultured Mucilaginibacter sp. TaxID=797541 RepID=UPI0025D11EEC|nr:hypothetical protein [uncultured Mucilaginibacter sp.]